MKFTTRNCFILIQILFKTAPFTKICINSGYAIHHTNPLSEPMLNKYWLTYLTQYDVIRDWWIQTPLHCLHRSSIVSQIIGKSTGCETAYLGVQQQKTPHSGPLWGDSTGDRLFLSQRASNERSVPCYDVTYLGAIPADIRATLSIMMNHDRVPVTFYRKWRHTTISIRVVITGSSNVITIYTACYWCKGSRGKEINC